MATPTARAPRGRLRIAVERVAQRSEEGSAALDVCRCVTYYHHGAAGDLESELFARAALSDGRQLGAVMMVRAEGADPESGHVDPGGTQLQCRTRAQVAREEAEDDVVASLEDVEQLGDSLEDMCVKAFRELRLQAAQIILDERHHPFVYRFLRVPFKAHQVTHDLRIGLPVVTVVGGTRAAEDVHERGRHRAAAGAVAPENGPVYVEEY